MYKNVEQACKNMFIACVPSEYYIKLKGKHTGYNGVALWTMINHVYNERGKITLEMKKENEDLMKAEFDINTNTLEELWVCQDACQELLIDEKETITEELWLRHTETVLKATRQFNKACDKWGEKQYFDKSKANCIAHMDDFHTKYLDHRESLEPVGVASNAEMEAMKQQIKTQTAKMTELINITKDFNDRLDAASVMSGVPASIGMTSAATATDARVLAIREQITQLLLLQRQPTNSGRGRDGSGGGGGDRVRGSYDRFADDGRTEKRFPNQNYFYSHG